MTVNGRITEQLPIARQIMIVDDEIAAWRDRRYRLEISRTIASRLRNTETEAQNIRQLEECEIALDTLREMRDALTPA